MKIGDFHYKPALAATTANCYLRPMVDYGVVGKTALKMRQMTQQDELIAHCASCRCERIFERPKTRHLRHLMSTLLTGGLWSFVWLAVSIERALRPWRCEQCGWHKPEFRTSLQEALQMGEAALHGSRRQSAIRMLQRDYSTSRLIH